MALNSIYIFIFITNEMKDNIKRLVKMFSKIPWQLPIFLTSLLCTSWGHIRAAVWVRAKGSGKTAVLQPILLDSPGHWGHWPSRRKVGPTTVASCTFDIFALLWRLISVWIHNDFIFNYMRDSCGLWKPPGLKVKDTCKILTLETWRRAPLACVWQLVDNSDFYHEYK